MTVETANSRNDARNLFLPPSGLVLGRFLSALRISHPDLRTGTASRYFRGEAISEAKRRELLRTIGRAIDDAGLLPPIPALVDAKKRGKDPSVLVAHFLLQRARHWDMQRARMGMWGLRFDRPELVTATLLRETIVDLAIRMAAYLIASTQPLQSDRWDWLQISNRKMVFRESLDAWDGPRPSLDALADLSGLSPNTIDAWLYNGARPRRDNLRDFCSVLADHMSDSDVEVLANEINLKLAIATLFDALANYINEDIVLDAFDHGVRYAFQLSQSGRADSPHASLERGQAVAIHASLIEQNPLRSRELLAYLIAREPNIAWRTLLFGSHTQPAAYWQLVAKLSGSRLARGDFDRWEDEGNEVSDVALVVAANTVIRDFARTVEDVDSIEHSEIRGAAYVTTLRLVAADIYELLGRADESVSLIKELLEQNTQSAFLHWRLGKAYAAASDKVRAMREYWIATAFAPQWEEPWSTIAIAQFQSDDLDEAATTLDRAFAEVTQPGADLYFVRGGLELISKNFVEAHEMFERVIALRPRFGSAYELLARCASHLGHRQEARRSMRLAYKYGIEDNILPIS